jgi:hypothetical protein
VHGNGANTLGVLGGQVASLWHGWASVHGRPRGFLLQGIDPLVCDGAGGEVTGLGMVDGLLPKLGCPRWPWRRPGRHGVFVPCPCELGPGLGCQQGGVLALGVDGGRVVKE